MTGASDQYDTTPPKDQVGSGPVSYPVNQVLAVLDTRAQADAATADLRNRGYIESEVQVGTGVERADELDSATGRKGLADLLMRFAERIGLTNEEIETKNRYEQAMRDNRFVVSVAAPTEDRKQRAVEILREHGAHTVAYFGKHTIEHITPPRT